MAGAVVRKGTTSCEPGVEIFPCANGSYLLPKRCAEAAEAPASPSTESLKELLYWEDSFASSSVLLEDAAALEAAPGSWPWRPADVCRDSTRLPALPRAGSGAQAQVRHSGGVAPLKAAGSSWQDSTAGRQTPGPSTLTAPAHDYFACAAPSSPGDYSPFDAWEDALGAAEEHCVPDALAGVLGAHREALGSPARPLDACSGSNGEADWDRLMAAACRASASPSGSPRGVLAATAHSPAAGAAESGKAGEPKAESLAGEHGACASCSMAWSGPCAGIPASSGGAAAAGAMRGDGGSASAEREGGQAGRRRGRPRRYDVGQLLQAAEAAGAGGVDMAHGTPGKRKRGNKPKCERNRDTALRSYYKRKAEHERLRGEIAALREDRAALEELLRRVQAPSTTRGRVGELLRQGGSAKEVLAMVSVALAEDAHSL